MTSPGLAQLVHRSRERGESARSTSISGSPALAMPSSSSAPSGYFLGGLGLLLDEVGHRVVTSLASGRGPGSGGVATTLGEIRIFDTRTGAEVERKPPSKVIQRCTLMWHANDPGGLA